MIVVFLAGRVRADDESDRNDLLQQIDEKVRAIADKLDGLVSDSDASDLDAAISYADDVKDLVSRLDSIKGDDSHANDVVSSSSSRAPTTRRSRPSSSTARTSMPSSRAVCAAAGPVHPDPQQVSGITVGRRELGDRAVRPPHWGTYLSRAHVAAVGGRDRLAEIVQPPVMRETGELLYLQLSERAADALSPEVEARRRAFAELLEPITLPRAG